MRLALLCNCSWRFKNFNIDHRDVEDCRNAHVELWDRIKELNPGSTNCKKVDELVTMSSINVDLIHNSSKNLKLDRNAIEKSLQQCMSRFL